MSTKKNSSYELVNISNYNYTENKSSKIDRYEWYIENGDTLVVNGICSPTGNGAATGTSTYVCVHTPVITVPLSFKRVKSAMVTFIDTDIDSDSPYVSQGGHTSVAGHGYAIVKDNSCYCWATLKYLNNRNGMKLNYTLKFEL